MPTQTERSDATTASLLDQARRLFGRDGFAQTWTEDIVKAAEVSRGALYHHYGNKRELFAAVFEREEERLASQVAAAAAAGSGPLERIRLGCLAFLQACVEPEFQRIHLIDGPSVLGVEHVRKVESGHTYALLYGALTAASSGDPEDVAVRASLLLGALCEGGIFVALSPDPAEAVPRVARQVELLLDGFLGGQPG